MSRIRLDLPYILKEMGNIHETDGRTELRPAVKVRECLDLEKVAKKASDHHRCHGSAATTVGIILDFFEEMKEQLAYGNTVKIDGVGVFSLSLSDRKRSERRDEEGEILSRPNAESIFVSDVNFRADRHLIQEVNAMAAPKREGTSLRVKSPYTAERRLEMLKCYLQEHGFIRVSAYAGLVQLSISSATKELRQWSLNTSSGIGWEGRRNNKVYILRK